MTQLDAVRWPAEQQHRHAQAIALFKRCVGIYIQLDDANAVMRGKRCNGGAHVVAEMTVGAAQQRQRTGRAGYSPLPIFSVAKNVLSPRRT